MNVQAFLSCAEKRICPVCCGSNVRKWNTPTSQGSNFTVNLLVCDDCGGVPLLCTLTGCIRFGWNLDSLNIEFCPFCGERNEGSTHIAIIC